MANRPGGLASSGASSCKENMPDDLDRPYDPYDPEDPDNWAAQRCSLYGAQWDCKTNRWVCICPTFRMKNACWHTTVFRGTAELQVKEEYL